MTAPTSRTRSARPESKHTIVNAEGDAATQQSQAEQAIADGAEGDRAHQPRHRLGRRDHRLGEGCRRPGDRVRPLQHRQLGWRGLRELRQRRRRSGDGRGARADHRRAPERPDAGRHAERRRGGQQRVPLPRRVHGDRREARSTTASWALVADQFVPGWGANGEGQGIMEQVLTDANNKVDAVFAANDNLATQAINALEAAGVGPVPLSGQDATAAGIQQIILGKQTMTVYKPIQAEADVAAKAALALCAGEDPADHHVRLRVRDDRDHGRGRQAGRGRRGRAVPRTDADRRDRRQHHGHRDRGRVPDDRGDLHRRHRGNRLLHGERLTDRPRTAGTPSGVPAPLTRPWPPLKRRSSSAWASRRRSAPSRRSTRSISRFAAARSWRWSATTAPASRP